MAGEVTLVDIEELADKMIAWSKQEGNIVLNKFIAEQGYPMSTFNTWLQRSEKLQEAYSIARTMVGCRREQGAIEGKYNPFIVMKTMPLYDHEYKAHLEWESKLKTTEQIATAQKIVVLEKFPESDKVPPLMANHVKEEARGTEGNKA